MNLGNVNALVTGGASGLGLAVVERLLDAGARVATMDIHGQAQHTLAKEVGKEVLFLHGDVSSEASVDKAVAAAVGSFGTINVAINCAGIVQSKRVLGREKNLTQTEFAKIINVNLIGTFNVCRSTAYAMSTNPPDKEGERGVIINTASIAAYEGQVGQAAYAASKGGVISLTLPLAREFSRLGIRVMAIAPGVFETPLFENIAESAREHLLQAIPFPHRLGKAVEFAQLVCSIIENPMLNGEVIRLDGALRMPVM